MDIQAENKNPKVFVSHATEDKDRFVNEFAKRLCNNGIDAWLDKWEMLPGDSLVDKIFEEGIKQSSAIIIIISQNSIDKKWVREELNVSFIEKLQKGTKLIPIIIDECKVPMCLQSTVWIKINNLTSYNEEFNRILMSILGITEKPIIKNLPKFTNLKINTVLNLSKTDTIVLKISGDIAVDKGYGIIESSQLFKNTNEIDIPDQICIETLEVLDNRRFINLSKSFSGISHIVLTSFGFSEYGKAFIEDFDGAFKRIALKILNDEKKFTEDFSECLNLSIMHVNHILSEFESKGFINCIKTFGYNKQVYSVSPELNRWFESTDE
jgi:hypothetical protein